MSLRGELMERLLNIRGKIAADSKNVFATEPFEYEVASAMADEMSRQMEWVRSECYDQVGGAAEDTGDAILHLKLTLAPKEWKP